MRLWTLVTAVHANFDDESATLTTDEIIVQQ